MKILVTGGAGFIGSNLILHWIEKHPEDQILNIDKLTYAADPTYLKSVENHPHYHFKKIDIVDRSKVHETLREFRPDSVIHLAAESHVDNSIAGPEPFVFTNVVGTFNLLEEARQLWSESPKGIQAHRFYHVSTDEVYGTLGSTGAFLETTPYAPNSPYSASKAASDHLVRAYHHTYGFNTVLSSCSNNYGPHQHGEKLIPTVIRTALAHKPIPVYGKGENVRDWLFVRDHCEAIDAIFHKGQSGETYNIGGRNEKRNIDLVREICSVLDELSPAPPSGGHASLIQFVKDRAGHDFRYAIDPSKLENSLRWKPTLPTRPLLEQTVRWYFEKGKKS